METKKYISLSKLETFLDNLNKKFATKTEVDGKADTVHYHNDDYDAKGSADTAYKNAQAYTDNAVAQKSQVQIITWEADD